MSKLLSSVIELFHCLNSGDKRTIFGASAIREVLPHYSVKTVKPGPSSTEEAGKRFI